MARAIMDVPCGMYVFRLTCLTLKTIGVPFFLLQGTALGAYRDNGFTPTERDIDLGFLQEDFDQFITTMVSRFSALDFDCRVVSKPFSRPRALKLVCHKFSKPIKVDLCAYQRFGNKRFCSSNLEPYSIVHPADVLEPPYHQTVMYSVKCNLPSPVEKYLRHEYGPNWQTPIDTHISTSRIYNFRRDNGITDDFLDVEKQPV